MPQGGLIILPLAGDPARERLDTSIGGTQPESCFDRVTRTLLIGRSDVVVGKGKIIVSRAGWQRCCQPACCRRFRRSSALKV